MTPPDAGRVEAEELARKVGAIHDITPLVDALATHAETIRRLEAQVAALQEDRAELTAAMAEAEPRLMAEHAAVLAAIPFVNRCRNWWDGTDLYIPRSGLLATEKDTGDLLRAAARALDATRGFLPMPGTPNKESR